MKVEQLYTGCLAEAAYYIESEGEVAIIDPLRETDQYVSKAEANGAKIKYIFETHFHADFVSGHIDLAKKTGATIIYGPKADTNYPVHVARDGEEFTLGKTRFKVLHTPGHTMESSIFLLFDENGKEKALFTGDTLFIGDVGRPDLAIKSDLTKEDLAGMLYDSIHEKILPLPDHIVVYPAHGAGSACGKNMSSETTDTLGNQKKTNYALDTKLSKEAFVKELTTGILPPPVYFASNAKMNKEGYDSLEKVMRRGNVALDPATFESIADHERALVIDTRNQLDYTSEHIPNSIFIGIDGNFAPWVGALIPDINQPILFIADDGREEEVITRLSRVGYDHTLGYLKGGIEAWKKAGKEVDSIESIDVSEFRDRLKTGTPDTLDVRKPSEYEAGHLIFAENLPLDFINENMNHLNHSNHYYIHCLGGYRSVIAASILRSRGFKNLTNVEGGYKALLDSSIPESSFTNSETV